MPWRLRSQLALVIAVAMAPAGLVAIIQAVAGANDEIEQREAVFASEVRAAALRERDALQQIRTALATAADEAEAALLATGNCSQVLDRFADERADIERVALLDAAGDVVCSGDGWTSPGHLPEWERFKSRPAARFSLNPLPVEDGSWSVFALHPTVFMRPNAFALAAELKLSQLQRLPQDPAGRRAYGVIDATGTLLEESAAERADWLPADPVNILGNIDMTIAGKSADGHERLYITQPLINGQIWAVASVPRAGFWEVIGSSAGLVVLGPLLLWLIAVIVAYISIDKLVTRHVAYLGRAAKRIGRGELGREIRRLESAPREIRALGDAIRDMAGNLERHDAGMRDAIERQKNLILEIHHRVKNNLQMVTSLINIQIRRAKSEEERVALQFLENRVQSLAVVHQHLYGSEELDRVPLDDLVRDITNRLQSSMTPDDARVEIRYKLTSMIVDSRVATPVALFLTEAISNVFKHAVPAMADSWINVSLRREGTEFALEIENPIHEAISPDTNGRQGLGMRLLRSFATQLGGKFQQSAEGGVFRLSLRAPLKHRAGEVSKGDMAGTWSG
ncbi:MAG TPA: sensor histidine kinase [Paracoccaceae bacterium]|nr:sensor histidine kinase [Paracoccaceae bacterium]